MEGKVAAMWKRLLSFGEPPLVSLSSYPLLISLISPPRASSPGDF